MCCRPDTRRFSGRRWKAGSKAGCGFKVYCRLQLSTRVRCLLSGEEHHLTAETKGSPSQISQEIKIEKKHRK
jgi:hypothetical protein